MSFLSQDKINNHNSSQIEIQESLNKENNNNENKENKLIKEKYKIIQDQHPLEFYALGKYNINMANNSLISFSSPRFRTNRSSHDLFNRNILSVNNPYFDNLKQVKNITSKNKLNKLNYNGNNYLDPLLVFKIRKEQNKEEQKKNNINSIQWFNLVKNKIYTIDTNSKIKKGKNISKNQFYESKYKIIISPKKIKENNNEIDNKNNYSYNNNSLQIENKKNLLEGLDYNYNTNYSIDNIFNCKRFKKDNEKLNRINECDLSTKKDIDYWKKLRIEKSRSTDELFKNLKKYDEKVLKNNFKALSRNRNWWKVDK